MKSSSSATACVEESAVPGSHATEDDRGCGLWLFSSFAFIALFLGGCVTHSPVSESIMFHDAATSPAHERNFGVGVVATYAPARGVAAALAEREYPRENSSQPLREDLAINPNRLSAGLYFVSFGETGRLGIALTAGLLVAGIDATAKLWGRNYATVALSAGAQQVFVQRRTYNSPRVGAAVGFGYRREMFLFNGPGNMAFTSLDIDSFGIRGFVLHRSDDASGQAIKLGTYIGFIPSLDRPIVGVTLTAGGI